MFLANTSNNQPIVTLCIVAGGNGANYRHSFHSTAETVRNVVDRRHKSEPAEFADRRSRINKRRFREEVDLDASFNKSPQKQCIRGCDAPRLGLYYYESSTGNLHFGNPGSRFETRIHRK